MDDIEDLVRSMDTEVTNIRSNERKYIVPKVRKTVRNEVSTAELPMTCDSIIPGTHRIFVKTWGCAHNSSDSEYMAGQLASYGYQIVDDRSTADLWLLNSCTVKNPAEDHFRNEINAARQSGKHIVVAGCVAQSVPSVAYLKGLSIIGVQQIDRVVEVVEETLKGNSVRLLSKKKVHGQKAGGASLALPKIRRNNLIEIIPISTGCLNHCTYCKTKHARGELGSYPIEEIVDRARQAFTEGVCELWITSEDTGAYGCDIGTSLPDLLWKLVEVIPDGCMLRIGMTNPPYILDHLQEMAKILAHPKVYSFLHIPVQSGSDPVLADMKREYCVDDFCEVVNFLRERVPGITIATDIICGFPTETDENFDETLALVEKFKFPSLFINQFYPRPGTPAAKMPRISSQDVKKRTKKISELFASYYPYDHKIGEVQTVLVTELSTDNNYYIGHNKNYEQVLLPKNEKFMGHIVEVKITSTGKHFLMGQPTSDVPLVCPGITPPLPRGSVSGRRLQEIVSYHRYESSYGQWPLVVMSVLVGYFLHKLIYYCYIHGTSSVFYSE